MTALPLQNKKMQRLTLPYIKVGSCEVMNLATASHMEVFHVLNQKNRSLYQNYSSTLHGGASTQIPFMGDMVGGGLTDSYTGPAAPRFISQYLSRALSMHTIMPSEIRGLYKEFPQNPLVDIMRVSAARRNAMYDSCRGSSTTNRCLPSLFTEWEAQQYALCADAAFFAACRDGQLQSAFTEPDLAAMESLGRRPPEESGCRAVWFTATVAPTLLEAQQRRSIQERTQQLAPPPRKTLDSAEEAEKKYINDLMDQSPFCLDVMVSGVGNARAFGIARNRLTTGVKSVLDPERERVVPLSVDHTPLRTGEYRRIIQAGGSVDSAVGDLIDGNPYLNVSRSFGHFSMKRNPKRSPVEQKIIALPTSKAWRMLEGDVLVLCNHAIFETRHSDDSSMDELAKVVGRSLSRDAHPEAIAGTLCDFAIRFGSAHSLQVIVAVATKPEETQQQTSSSSDAAYATNFEEWVEPGPLYVEACRRVPSYRQSLQRDCERCGITLAALLRQRWHRVKHLLPERHALPLLPYYGRECSILQQAMEEEALFFSPVAAAIRDGARDKSEDQQLEEIFRSLAWRLSPRASPPASGGEQAVKMI